MRAPDEVIERDAEAIKSDHEDLAAWLTSIGSDSVDEDWDHTFYPIFWVNRLHNCGHRSREMYGSRCRPYWCPTCLAAHYQAQRDADPDSPQRQLDLRLDEVRMARLERQYLKLRRTRVSKGKSGGNKGR